MEFGWKRLNRQIDEYQSELVQTHYAEVENMYRQMRGWRHDYRNHIQTMKAYAAKGDLEALRRYLDELDDDLTTLDMVIKTGNPMTDAILNSKISLARSKQVQVVADAHIPVKLRLPELDLCCILGNLFDNAIEASLQLPEPERLIRVYMEMKGEQLYISFTNFTAGKKLKKTAGRFATSKGKGHGLGLMQMDRIIRRLRKPGDTAHYLPRGGMFRYVTSANYFGEIVEWTGFAILTWSASGAVFALWTFANLVPRADAIYKRYAELFGDELRKERRKRVIPFIY